MAGSGFWTWIGCAPTAPDSFRVARYLAEMFNPILYPGFSSQIRISQEELGYLTGISRQRVNQALQALDKLGLIRVGYAGIEILDAAQLRAFGSSPPGT